MNEPYVNLNWLSGVAMTACIFGLPFWLLGLISGRLFLVILVFFVGMVFLSNWADSQSGQ